MGCTQLKGQQYKKQLHRNRSTIYSTVNHNTEEHQSRNAHNTTAYTKFTLGRTLFTLANSKEPQRAGTDALIPSEQSRVWLLLSPAVILRASWHQTTQITVQLSVYYCAFSARALTDSSYTRSVNIRFSDFDLPVVRTTSTQRFHTEPANSPIEQTSNSEVQNFVTEIYHIRSPAQTEKQKSP